MQSIISSVGSQKLALGGKLMAVFHHIRRRNFDHTRHSGRISIDDMVRSTDVTLHVLVIALLIAFAFGTLYLYGAMGPVVDAATPVLRQ
jgi:hypothetical protein